MLKNDPNSYGWLSIVIHWVSTAGIFFLFGLGLYMVELDYYHPWYHLGTHWHESLGILFFALTLLRLLWRQYSPVPQPISHASIAKRAHWLLYLLIIIIPISGYLISTADGHPVKLFNWLTLTSLTGKIDNLESISGNLHYWLSMLLMGLTAGHIAAAIKHHWIDRDNTLRRMLKPLVTFSAN